MLFNSLEFLLFSACIPVVFALYWMANHCWTKASENLTIQNTLLLLASYVFYGWWDWRFLSLIAFSTIVDWFVGLQIHQANEADNPSDLLHRSRKARRWLTVSFVVNLGLLGYFKYANFFIENWVNAWAIVGVTMHTASLQLILPVGISFYTFQTLSYSIDIYRRQLKPTRSILNFAAFVSFFPQLVAGPIEEQVRCWLSDRKRRTFDLDLAVSGLRLIVLGMFKKVVVADNCAIFVNDIFNNFQDHSGPTLALGAICFAFQIYGDFSKRKATGRHCHRYSPSFWSQAHDQLQNAVFLSGISRNFGAVGIFSFLRLVQSRLSVHSFGRFTSRKVSSCQNTFVIFFG